MRESRGVVGGLLGESWPVSSRKICFAKRSNCFVSSSVDLYPYASNITSTQTLVSTENKTCGGGGGQPPLSWMWVRICPPILFTISATFSIAAWVRGGTLDGKGSKLSCTLTVCLREFTPFADVDGGSLRDSRDRESIDEG